MFANIKDKKINKNYEALLRRNNTFPAILDVFIVLADKAGWTHSEILEAIADAVSAGDAETLREYCL